MLWFDPEPNGELDRARQAAALQTSALLSS